MNQTLNSKPCDQANQANQVDQIEEDERADPQIKQYWQKDSEVSACNSCKRPFTVFRRRSHCR